MNNHKRLKAQRGTYDTNDYEGLSTTIDLIAI